MEAVGPSPSVTQDSPVHQLCNLQLDDFIGAGGGQGAGRSHRCMSPSERGDVGPGSEVLCEKGAGSSGGNFQTRA